MPAMSSVKSTEMCRDFLNHSCKRKSCNYVHPTKGGPGGSKDPGIVSADTGTPGGGPKDEPVCVEIGPSIFKVASDHKRQEVSLTSLAYALAELPVRLAANDVHFPVCKEFCIAQNIRYIEVKYTPNGITHHPIDGKIIRDVAARRGLSVALRLIAHHSLVNGPVEVVDLWGNNRTRALMNQACGTFGADQTLAKSLVNVTIMSQIHDGKDLFRNNNASLFVPIDMNQLEGKHIVLIQDVQQSSTTKDKLLSMLKHVHVLVVVCHIEHGPMGFNGYDGFYLRQDDKILNWASPKDAPYFDREDMTWVMDGSSTTHEGIHITWCVQQVYGNAVFIVFTKAHMSVGNSVIDMKHDFADVKLEVTNPWLYRFNNIPCLTTVSSYFNRELVNRLGGYTLGSTEHGVVYLPIAYQGADFLIRKTHGPGTDKLLDGFVSDAFAKIKRFDILRVYDHEAYTKLIIFTTAHAKRLETKRLYDVSRLGVATAGAIKQVNLWRNLDAADTAFDRCNLSCFGSALICCCMMLPASVPTCYTCFKIPVIINANNLASSDIPPAFIVAIDNKAEVDTMDINPGVYKFGVFQRAKRHQTMTPAPTSLRLGPTGKIYTFVGEKTIPDVFDADEVEETKLKGATFHYGPSYVPWHANQASVGHAIGVLNALLTPVNLPDGTQLSALESGRRGQLLMKKSFMRMTQHQEVYVGPDLQKIWCSEHKKRAIYLPALLKTLENGSTNFGSTGRVVPKINELMLKDKERVLVGCKPEVVAYHGYEASVLTQRFKEEYSVENLHNPVYTDGVAVAHFTWGSGTTPESRGAWFDESMTLPENHFSVTSCGDDCAATLNLGGVILGVETDVRNYDHSQVLIEDDGHMVGALNVQYEYYKAAGASSAFLSSLKQITKVKWQTNVATRTGFAVELGYGRRLSGGVDTTDGNTLNMGHTMCAILSEVVNHWDETIDDLPSYVNDMIIALGAKYGLYLKVKVHEDVYCMTFLKGFYVDCRVRGKKRTLWYPSPEILTKIGTSESNPCNNKAYRDLQKAHPTVKNLPYALRAYDIVNSWRSFTGLPVLGAYQKMIQAPIATTYEESRLRYQTDEKWDKPELSVIATHHDWDPMLSTLGIKELLPSFTELASRTKWEPGMYIAHPLIKTLASRYA